MCIRTNAVSAPGRGQMGYPRGGAPRSPRGSFPPHGRWLWACLLYTSPNKTEYDALAQTLHYAENDTKTKLNESAQLVTGIHCRADHVWEDMRAVQERFGKTDGVVALHAYQSFREGEVTPEQCHEIGVALARKVWGKRFQVLVATHMNTNNLHNHFVINSVSYVDGKKYEQRRSQYAEFRAASDKLCRDVYKRQVLPLAKNTGISTII